MNKNEILAKSREENKNQDEREKLAIAKASQKATFVGAIVCCIFIVLDIIFDRGIFYPVYSIYLSMTGATLLFKYFYLKKKHELIFGIIELCIAVAFIVLYVINKVILNG